MPLPRPSTRKGRFLVLLGLLLAPYVLSVLLPMVLPVDTTYVVVTVAVISFAVAQALVSSPKWVAVVTGLIALLGVAATLVFVGTILPRVAGHRMPATVVASGWERSGSGTRARNWRGYHLVDPAGHELDGPMPVGSRTEVPVGAQIDIVVPAFGDRTPVYADQADGSMTVGVALVTGFVGATAAASWWMAGRRPLRGTSRPAQAPRDSAETPAGPRPVVSRVRSKRKRSDRQRKR
jgi:hypothetical protein